MKRVFTLLLICLSLTVFASQEKTFLDENFNPISDLSDAKYYRCVSKADENLFFSQVYYLTDIPQMRGHYKDSLLTVLHGPCTYYHVNGKIESQGKYENGQRVDTWKRFTMFGEEKNDRYYPRKNELDAINEKESSLAKFKDSSGSLEEYINDNLIFPTQAELLEINSGKVSINLSINEVGEITHTEVLSSTTEAFKREALLLVSKMESWIPAKISGKNVSSNYIIQVPFNGDTKRETYYSAE